MRNILKVAACLACLVYMSVAVVAGRGDLWSVGTADTPFWAVRSNGQFVPDTYETINSTNTTVNGSTSPTTFYLVNMSGNHTFTLPTVATAGARARYRIIAAGNNIGTTGNLTISAASSGNVNTIDSLTVTNTSGATGAVQVIDCYADKTVGPNDWFVTVTRR